MRTKWKSEWTFIIVLTLVLRIGYAFMGSYIVSHQEQKVLAPGAGYEQTVSLLGTDEISRRFINPWFRWDTVWYLNIASFGTQAEDGWVSFAPLYPLLIRVFSSLFFGKILLVGLSLSTIFLIVALILLYELNNEKIELVISLLLFPTAFFFFAAYTESLFLMLVLATFTSAQQKKWLLASIFAGVSVFARFQGVVLTGIILWMMLASQLKIEHLPPWQQVTSVLKALKKGLPQRLWERGQRTKWLFPLIPALFLFLYFAWLQFAGHGSPSATLERLWGIQIVMPLKGFFLFTQRLLYKPRVFIDWIDLSLFIFILTLAIIGLKRLSPAYSIYVWGSLGIMFMRGTPPHLLDSFSRYVLILFPLFFLLTDIPSRIWKISLASASLFLQTFLLMLFFDWMWIA